MNPDITEPNITTGLHRPSMRVAKAAALLEVDISTIYKLVRAGALEAHRVGKRGVRIFADGLRSYQEQGKISAHGPSATDNRSASAYKKINSLGYSDAVSYLRSIGCL